LSSFKINPNGAPLKVKNNSKIPLFIGRGISRTGYVRIPPGKTLIKRSAYSDIIVRDFRPVNLFHVEQQTFDDGILLDVKDFLVDQKDSE
jgi:hypothetical protein